MKCETEDCVLREKDKFRFKHHEYSGERLKFMEGYQPQSLVMMKSYGRLEIHKWSAAQATAFAAIGPVFGAAKTRPAKYGDMYSCKVWYSPIKGWQWFLSHELSHCLGYKERGLWINFAFDDYTRRQKEIMKEEGVSKWSDTRFYREDIKKIYSQE